MMTDDFKMSGIWLVDRLMNKKGQSTKDSKGRKGANLEKLYKKIHPSDQHKTICHLLIQFKTAKNHKKQKTFDLEIFGQEISFKTLFNSDSFGAQNAQHE